MKLIDVSTRSSPDTFAMVDDEDFDWLNQWKWKINDTGYATRRVVDGGVYKIIRMHRVILNPAKGLVADHIDGNRLNNQRSNLRVATLYQNACNSGKILRPATSKYKGVSWNKKDRRWQATIVENQKSKHLGQFRIESQAAKAYNAAAARIFGEFAKLNLILEDEKA